MRYLPTYLWKEWRDHRAVLLGMVLAVPFLMAVMGLSLPDRTVDARSFSPLAALACLALFVVSIATDLVPGERRRGHLRFLERLPGGLRAAFLGKLLLFVVGAALFSAYGWAGGCLLVLRQIPAPPEAGATLWIVAIAAIWTFAVSCALPRGALSLPAVASLALLLALPVALLWKLYPSTGPSAWWRWESGALWTAGGVLAAWAGFRRSGGGFRRAGSACLGVAALCALPYWADSGWDAWKWHRTSSVGISQAFLGEGGRYAFVNRLRWGRGSRSSPVSPVIVDLRTGAVRESFGKLERLGPIGWHFWGGIPHRYLYLWGHAEPVPFDARTAERAAPTAQDLRDADRARALWRYPDGRAVWFRDGRLKADDGMGRVKEVARDCSIPCGVGLESWSPRGFYDLPRERFFPARGLALRGEQVWIRTGLWLTLKNGEYRLFSPETGLFAPALGLLATDSGAQVLDDGRVLVFRGKRGLVAVDPESGGLSAVPMPPGFEGGLLYGNEHPARTPEGRRVFQIVTRGEPWMTAFLRHDGEGFSSTAAFGGHVGLLGCLEGGVVIASDERAIYRVRFGSDEREEIWRAR